MTDHITETLRARFDGRPVIPHDEAASLLLLSERALREIGNDGEIEYQVSKRKRAYTLATLDEFLRRAPCRSISEPTSKKRRTGIASRSKDDGFMGLRAARKGKTPKRSSVSSEGSRKSG